MTIPPLQVCACGPLSLARCTIASSCNDPTTRMLSTAARASAMSAVRQLQRKLSFWGVLTSPPFYHTGLGQGPCSMRQKRGPAGP